MKSGILLACVLSFFSFQGFSQQFPTRKSDLRVMFDYEKTKDPLTGDIPKDRLLKAKEKAKAIKLSKKKTTSSSVNYAESVAAAISLGWTERGPYADAIGPSNGNTRPNSDITAGRVRAIWPDLADNTGKTVWAAGVDGGLWKTTDITTSPANWQPVDDDQFDNLAITSIAQDPTNTNVLYAATGESYMSLAGGKPSINAVKGVGVYKSSDHGVTWTLLSSTGTGAFAYCTKIVCGSNGYVYVATRMVTTPDGSTILFLGALRRSTDGGATWTDITPSVTYLPNPQYAGTGLAGYSTGQIGAISDIEISSTGRMHVVSGMLGYAQYYAYTNNPGTVTSSSGWANAVAPFSNYSTSTAYTQRTELAVKGDTLYALPVRSDTRNADTIWKSTNGGANWSKTAGQISNMTNGQGYYDLAVAINPVNANECIVGGLDTWKTVDGGATWSQISTWVGTTGQYVHADQHNIAWYDGGNKLLFSSDGGVFFSADKGATIRDRNSGLNIKQFYSTVIHPTSANYMLAGAQDNGTHQLNGAGLTTSVEVKGGDGGFVAIDQTDPQFQFGTYVYGSFRRSTNSGSNWSSIDFYKGSSAAASYMGQFINAYALDDSTETIYAGAGAGEFFRWTTATTSAAGTYYQSGTPSFPTGASIISGVTAFGGGVVSAVKISPYKLNRVFFGTTAGKIARIDSAYTAAASNPAATDITGSGMPTGTVYVSCINVGTTDSNLIACFSNYGVSNIWVSTNAGASWTAIDGDLADIPVRWVMFYPGDDTRAIIATETGVWTTDLINGSSTVWTTDASFPTVRTDMLSYRKTDRTLVAATHGRGLWTTTLPELACTPAASNIVPASSSLCTGTGTTLSLSQAYGTSSYTFQWMYATSSGGTYTNLSTSSTQATGNLNATTYYKCTITCITNGVTFTTPELAVSVTNSPSAPTGSGSERCGTGTVTFTATPPSGATIAWFNVSSGGTALATTNSYTTPSLSANTTYYAESRIGTTCVSSTRTAFTATINAVPAAPTAGVAGSRCGTGTVLINATTPSGVTVDWYAASTGGSVLTNGTGTNSFTTPSISTTTNYYAQARNSTSLCISSSRLTVAATVNAVPAAATSPLGASRCGTGTVTLSATAATGTTIDWYNASTAGTRLQAGTAAGVNTYTPTVSATTTFYAETRNLTTSCVASTRVAVTATVTVAPSAPTGSGVVRCGTGTVTFTATPPSGATIAWFNVSSGGTALATTNSYTTPSLSANTTYYAESRIGTTCVSSTRTAFTATINAVPAAPTAGTPGSRCGPGTVVINATTPAGITVDWYAASTGGTVLLNGAGTNTYTTPSITSTTNYYAQAKNSTTGCTSSTRLAVAATINAIPAAPASISVTGGTSTSGTLTICPVLNTNYNYTAASVKGVAAYKWTIPVCATPSTTPISTTNTLTAKFTGAGSTDSMKVQSRSTAGCFSVVRGVKVTSLTNCAACTAPVAASQKNTGFTFLGRSSDLDETVNVKVYPNPSLGVFNVQIQTPDKESILIKVVDIQGRVIEMMRANPYSNLMIGGKLKPGVYFFEVIQGKYKRSIKVIKN